MRKVDNKSSWGNDIFIILCRYNTFYTLSLLVLQQHAEWITLRRLAVENFEPHCVCMWELLAFPLFRPPRARLCSERRKKNCGYISWSVVFFPALQTLKLVPLRFFRAAGFSVSKVDALFLRKKKLLLQMGFRPKSSDYVAPILTAMLRSLASNLNLSIRFLQ